MVTPKNEVFLVYRFHPIIQKYDVERRLVFSKTIKNEDTRTLLEKQKAKLASKPLEPGSFDSYLFFTAAVSDNGSGLYVSVRGRIYHLDQNCDVKEVLHLSGNLDSEQLLPEALYLDRSNQLYTIDSITRKAYKYKLP